MVEEKAAKRLGSEAARFLDAKRPRGIDAWSVLEELFMCIPFNLLVLQ